MSEWMVATLAVVTTIVVTAWVSLAHFGYSRVVDQCGRSSRDISQSINPPEREARSLGGKAGKVMRITGVIRLCSEITKG